MKFAATAIVLFIIYLSAHAQEKKRRGRYCRYQLLALKKVFSNFKHIETDTDMNNIRNEPEFIEVIKKYNPKPYLQQNYHIQNFPIHEFL